MESGFNLADVNGAIKRLLGGTYKGHGKDYNTIRRVKYFVSLHILHFVFLPLFSRFAGNGHVEWLA